MYIITKTINGKEIKILIADTEPEAQYVVNALKANGIKTASYHRR